nr:unnamed protein product [Callosobruchus chinensis]
MTDGTFLVCISGQIEWIDVLAPAGSSWHCRCDFFSGPDWKIIGGLEAGLSQIAHVAHNGDKVVFNFPIEIQFKSTNPYGWPQIILSIYKGMQLAGYGRVHMPIKVGSHELDVALSKPQSSTMLGYIASFLATSQSCYNLRLIRMEHAGYARISINMVTQAFQSLGYDVGCNRGN